ncbi:uncharacterized protein BDR25DRAFT_341988 [Lindgomyces ingoldianus]|uniref:Uncharacterized protein n=1 Tax=Lindgomyces ingoldianus TaxID=673940 RepID=A0ACB6R0S2_9PLEO|nr:uncharacterized protein BDR25DRAFT_341988 [Lindgomyces ingoldianus]KAF2471920.1 hypothetical protein BDR25DRAFT_341988 [Lindgomyces ingoldianus]
MSADTLPITPSRFTAALADLPVSSLHAKVFELRNSIAHLEKSNLELEEWAREGDKECYEALLENRDVVRRMEERVELVRREIVEVRGLPFEPEKAKVEERDVGVDASQNGTAERGSAEQQAGNRQPQAQVQAQSNGDTTAEGEQGVFL